MTRRLCLFSGFLLACALTLLPQARTLAAVSEYGPSFGRFSVDVPSGWKASSVRGQQETAGVRITSPDKQTCVVILAGKAQGTGALELAFDLATDLGLADVGVSKNARNACMVSGTLGKMPCTLSVQLAEAGTYTSVVVTGKDVRGAAGILSTLQGR